MLSLASHIRLRATLRPSGCNSKTIPSVFLGIYELLILFCGAKIVKKRQINKYMPLFLCCPKAHRRSTPDGDPLQTNCLVL